MESQKQTQKLCEIKQICKRCKNQFDITDKNTSVAVEHLWGKNTYRYYAFKCPKCGYTTYSKGVSINESLQDVVLNGQTV